MDFKWLITHMGERLAAERLLHGLSEQDRVNVTPAFKPLLFSPRVRPPLQVSVPENRRFGWEDGPAQLPPLKVQARPRRHFQIGGRDLGRVIMHLTDTRRLLEEIRVTQPDFVLPRGTLREIHDALARIYRRLQHENRQIPSATDERYAALDQNLLCPTFGLLQFRRAGWTHDLIEVGEQLHNCVSGYAHAALCNEVVLVIARDALNVPRICLEIKATQILQYKLDHNQSPQTPHDLQTAEQYRQRADLRVRGMESRQIPAGDPPPQILAAHFADEDDLPF